MGIENEAISISVQILNCSSVSPRFRANDSEISESKSRGRVRSHCNDHPRATRTAGFLLSFTIDRSASGTEYRKSMFFEARYDVSEEAFATKGMSTGINAGK
jgi:hypothetical protein